MCRSDRLLGHNLRHPDLLTMLTEENNDRKNCVARKRLTHIDQIIYEIGYGGSAEMMALAQNRMLGKVHETNKKSDD